MIVRPTREALRRAVDKRLPDLVAPHLAALLVGINPGLYSAAIGHHFARPGNRFWKVLAGAGMTERVLSPYEDHLLLSYGFGLTNVVARTTARAEELSPDELVRGGRRLERLVRKYEPKVVAILGIGAFRVAFSSPKATLGRQERTIGSSLLWVLPNPSGLNAHHSLASLIEQFASLRAFLTRG